MDLSNLDLGYMIQKELAIPQLQIPHMKFKKYKYNPTRKAARVRNFLYFNNDIIGSPGSIPGTGIIFVS